MRVLVVGLVLVALAGCGGEDTIPLSEYVDRANAICQESNTEGRDEIRQFRDEREADGNLDRNEVQEVNRKALDTARDSTERLADIPPPDERRADAEAYEQRVREANDAFGDMIEAVEDGDTERAGEALDRNEKLIGDAKDLARDLGLDECAESS
jgi:hypothetical protein